MGDKRRKVAGAPLLEVRERRLRSTRQGRGSRSGAAGPGDSVSGMARPRPLCSKLLKGETE